MTLTALRRRSRPAVSLPKVVILASEASGDKMPKALTEIGGSPVLWHSMMRFAGYGMSDFVIAPGPHGEQLRHKAGFKKDWNVDLIDTGMETSTAARLQQLRRHLGCGAFLVTTGETVSDIDLDGLLAYHRSHGRLATAVAVRPPARFGRLEIIGDQVVEFTEKPAHEQGWTSASLFVLEASVFDYIETSPPTSLRYRQSRPLRLRRGESVSGDTEWEETLEAMARDGQLMAYRHQSFWGSVETLRDRQELEALWQAGNAPWKAS